MPQISYTDITTSFIPTTRAGALALWILKVREDTFASIENQKDVEPEEEPMLPIFFARAYNVLRKCARMLELADDDLDLLYVEVQNLMLQEAGNTEGMPEIDENGLLEAADEEETDENDIEMLFADTARFIRNHYRIHDEIPKIPSSFELARKKFDQVFETDPDFEEGKNGLTEQLEQYLRAEFGELIPVGYVPKG